MDNDTAQLQIDSPNDIFSLSDQVLSDRLEFIEEVRPHWNSHYCLRVLTGFCSFFRLALVIGAASGCAGPSLRPRQRV
jgi:hypothetical protein